MIVDRADGIFGPIVVRDRQGVRELRLNNQLQGGAFMGPAAEWGSPGAVSEAAYVSGWLMAGAHHPQADGLMVGLGSGCGVISLLHHFPEMTLRVLEIDPQMIAIACRCFPGLEHMMNRGQLEILECDAADYLAETDETYELGLFDAYDGQTQILRDSLQEMAGVCRALYVNVIDRLGGPSMTACLSDIQRQDLDVQEVFRVQPTYEDPFVEPANWVIAADDLDWRLIDEFQPYPGMSGIQAYHARRYYQSMIAQTASGLIEW